MKAKILTTLFTAGILISSHLYAGTLKVGASPCRTFKFSKRGFKKRGSRFKSN